jgi:hypothetical protein
MYEKKLVLSMSTNNNKIILPCEEANHVCDKSQYKEATFWEKVKLSIHLIYCKACRKYSGNNAKLTDVIKDNNVTCMDHNSKTKMQETLNKELTKQKQ